MPASTCKAAKLARQAVGDKMVVNDSVKLSLPKSKRTHSVSGMRQTKKQKTLQKAKKTVTGSGDSENQLMTGHERNAKARTAVAQFHEDDREVEFQVEAMSEDFLSEGEVHSSSSDSEIEFDQEPEHSRQTRLSHVSSSSRSRSRTRSRSRSHTRSSSHDDQPRRSHTPDQDEQDSHRRAKKKSYRKSMEQCLDKITDALTVMQQAFLSEGADMSGKQDMVNQDEASKDQPSPAVVIAGESETTIYRNAIEHEKEADITTVKGI